MIKENRIKKENTIMKTINMYNEYKPIGHQELNLQTIMSSHIVSMNQAGLLG